MPELPEVETVKNGLKSLLPGLKIKSVNFDWPKGFPNSKKDVDKFLVGASIDNVRRRGKVIIIDLSSGYSLLIHLKMTGQLVFRGETKFGAGHPTKSLIGKLPDKSTRVTIKFNEASALYFNDQRKFGWMKLMLTQEIHSDDFIKKLGPEPLRSGFSSADFIERLNKRKNSTIKAALLDQSVIAGVGNIYADESLFAAGIHPASVVSAIPRTRLIDLHEKLIDILRLSIKNGGTTDRNYVDALGRKGNYMDIAKVFRREKQACPICSGEIIKIRVAGRGTHICPKCQKLYKREAK
jgi:formamidopyrimidine-DNA glycosylase